MRRRANKRMRPEKRIACGVAVAAAIVVATTAFFGWRTYEAPMLQAAGRT